MNAPCGTQLFHSPEVTSEGVSYIARRFEQVLQEQIRRGNSQSASVGFPADVYRHLFHGKGRSAGGRDWMFFERDDFER